MTKIEANHVICHLHIDDGAHNYSLDYNIKYMADFREALVGCNMLYTNIVQNYVVEAGYKTSVTYHILTLNAGNVVIDSRVGQFYNLRDTKALRKELVKFKGLFRECAINEKEQK